MLSFEDGEKYLKVFDIVTCESVSSADVRYSASEDKTSYSYARNATSHDREIQWVKLFVELVPSHGRRDGNRAPIIRQSLRGHVGKIDHNAVR